MSSAETTTAPSRPWSLGCLSRPGSRFASICFGIVAIFGLYSRSLLQNTPAVDVPLESLPMQIGNWKGEDTEGLGIKEQDILKLNRYVRRFYRTPEGDDIYLYIGYWKKQSGDYQGAKHSPSICLPSSGWVTSRATPRDFEFQTPVPSSLRAKRLIAELKNRRRYFYYWFFAGDKTFSEEWSALFHLSVGALLYGRSDGGIVQVSAEIKRTDDPAADEARAQEVVDRFVRDFYPQLTALVTSKGPVTSKGSGEK